MLSISLFVSSGSGMPATDVSIVMTTSSAAVRRNGDIVATCDMFRKIKFQFYFIICIVKKERTRKKLK
jgi:hypothetical protein